MKPVSAEYKESMSASLRERSYARVTFWNTDPTAASDGEWENNGELSFSETGTLDYDYDYGATYATLELDRWLLDGSMLLLVENERVQDGFVSDHLSDEGGAFTSSAVLTREFSKDHTLSGLTLTFDTRSFSWPESVTCSFFLNDSLVHTVTVPVSGETVVIESKIDACNKISILFGSCLPRRRPRLERVLFGVEKRFSNEDIVSITQTHDVDPLSRRLPSENMSFTILDFEHTYDPDNPTGIWKYVDEKSPIAVQFGYTLPDGTVEWLKSDKYVLNGRPSTENNQASFSGTGLIGGMGSLFYKSKMGEKSLYVMAEEVLSDVKLVPTSTGENPWEIDESLKTMLTTAALPIDTHMNCLQLIAHAACCKLYTDDDNIIHIKPFSMPNPPSQDSFVLNFETIREKSQKLSKIDQLKSISVNKYSYVASSDISTLYEGTTNETLLHLEFSSVATDVSVSVTGGTLVSSEIYARAVDLVLSPGTKNITVTGKTVSENTVVTSYPVSQDGEVDVEENPLITNDAMCGALAAHIKQYLMLRNTYTAEYRGNPEVETGDIIGLQTRYTDNAKALVLANELTFNGALSGKVTVKMLQ